MADLDRIVRLKAVLSRTGLSCSTLYRKIREGAFPQQVRISILGAGVARVRRQSLDSRPGSFPLGASS